VTDGTYQPAHAGAHAVGRHPEVTARSDQRAQAIDQEFAQLADWISRGWAPISQPTAEFLVPKLATAGAGRLQLQQGREASAFAKQRFQERLTKPDGSQRFTRPRSESKASASSIGPTNRTIVWMTLPL
jgi:hypothetical protein